MSPEVIQAKVIGKVRGIWQKTKDETKKRITPHSHDEDE